MCTIIEKIEKKLNTHKKKLSVVNRGHEISSLKDNYINFVCTYNNWYKSLNGVIDIRIWMSDHGYMSFQS